MLLWMALKRLVIVSSETTLKERSFGRTSINTHNYSLQATSTASPSLPILQKRSTICSKNWLGMRRQFSKLFFRSKRSTLSKGLAKLTIRGIVFQESLVIFSWTESEEKFLRKSFTISSESMLVPLRFLFLTKLTLNKSISMTTTLEFRFEMTRKDLEKKCSALASGFASARTRRGQDYSAGTSSLWGDTWDCHTLAWSTTDGSSKTKGK